MNTRIPLVSVVLATYIKDDLAHLRQAIESILNQTFSCFEMIIIVDGPVMEETRYYLDKIEAHSNVILICLKNNEGPARARNIGIRAASGKYIAIMDSDDISVPTRLESQVEFIENNSADVVSTWLQTIDNNDNVVGIRKIPLTSKYIRLLAVIRCPLHNPSLMCLASVIKNNQYDESLRVSEDYDLWIRLISKGYNVLNMPLLLVKYRQDNESMNKRVGWQYFKSDLRVRIRALNMYPNMLKILILFPILVISLTRLIPLRLFKRLYIIKEKIL